MTGSRSRSYRRFAAGRRRTLRDGGRLADTTAGPIEYVDDGPGDGPPVLFFHGSPGGYDQIRLLRRITGPGPRLVGWSRPGYLRTPLDVGSTFAAQSDAAAALLDALGIDRAVAYGISGGGPVAVEFARRHPGRTAGLVLESAVAERYAPKISPLARAVFLSSHGTRLTSAVAHRWPRPVVADLVRQGSTFDRAGRARVVDRILADPRLRAIVRDLVDNLTPWEDRAAGLVNDLAQHAALDDTLTAGVGCPTLVLHGSHDGDVAVEHARHAAARIPDAVLHVVPEGWHLLPLSSRGGSAAAAARLFLASAR